MVSILGVSILSRFRSAMGTKLDMRLYAASRDGHLD